MKYLQMNNFLMKLCKDLGVDKGPKHESSSIELLYNQPFIYKIFNIKSC